MSGQRTARDIGVRRSDAQRNEQLLIRAATTAIHRDGLRVPLGVIATEAGVGIGTLYRHFPTRDHLLSRLTHLSFEQVLRNARESDRPELMPIEALRRFAEAGIAQRNELVLPLHGGPPITSTETLAVQREVHSIIQRILERGRRDGSLKADLTPRDIVIFGAMLAQPRTPDSSWDDICRRLLANYLDGLAPSPRKR